MDSDHDVQMDDETPVQWPTTKGKGKEKATEQPDGHDPENLPWCALLIVLPTCFCRLLIPLYAGWKSTDQSRWTTWSPTKTSPAPVCDLRLVRLSRTHSGIVEQFIQKNRLPHLLFYGPPGTGKTSTILAVARRIYGKDYRKQILEVSKIFHKY